MVLSDSRAFPNASRGGLVRPEKRPFFPLGGEVACALGFAIGYGGARDDVGGVEAKRASGLVDKI